MPTERRTLDELLGHAETRIRRYTPAEALAAQRAGATLIDIRGQVDRERDGVVPGALHIPLTVLPWRLDPESRSTTPHVQGLDDELILLCDHGCSTILAAEMLVELGFHRAGDVVGGYEAWSAAGLPTRPCMTNPTSGLCAGMGPPD